MQIEVRVYTGLEKYTGTRYGEKILVNIEKNTTTRDIMTQLNIPGEEVFSILINGLHKTPDTVLQEGDRVALFPPVGGG